MDNRNRKKELAAEYKNSKRRCGVYRMIHKDTGWYYLSHSRDLNSAEGRLRFAFSTGSLSFLDKRFAEEIGKLGMEGWAFEVLETLDFDDGVSIDKIEAELTALEELWREKLADNG